MKYLFALFIPLFISCKKGEPEPLGPRDIPFSLFFLIKENNVRLPDYTLNNLKLTYYEGGKKQYIKDLGRGTYHFDSLGVMVSLDIGFASADRGIKDFFLEYPNGDIDTLFVDYQNISNDQALENNCYCRTPLQELKFNGRFVSTDTSIKEQKVYLFSK